jgi:hypothetical protein
VASFIMKVVILRGGLRTRSREETEFRPKPMANLVAADVSPLHLIWEKVRAD